MSSKKKKIAVVVTAFFVLLVLFFILFKPNVATPKKESTAKDYSKDSDGCNTSINNQSVDGYSIGLGSIGNEVKEIQEYLNTNVLSKLCVDGNWGSKTEEAYRLLKGSDEYSFLDLPYFYRVRL